MPIKVVLCYEHLGDSLPRCCVGFLLLLVLCILIHYLELYSNRTKESQTYITKTLGTLAIRELVERKMNQELLLRQNISERNARLAERESISRNIHNSVGHTITSATMALDAAEALWDVDGERAKEKVMVANERIHTSLESIRRAVRVLDEETQAVALEDLEMELAAVIECFMMDTSRSVTFRTETLGSELMIPREYTEFLTGAFEELLTNGVKHGNADHFLVYLVTDSKHLRLSVSDNGKSDFCEANAKQRLAEGFGLKKIESYLIQHGGSAVFTAKGGFHTEISMHLEMRD